MATEYLYPNAAGDETNLTPYPNTGEANWQDVDDPQGSPDDDTTRVGRSTGDYLRDLYNLSAPTGSGTINYISVHYRFKKSSSGATTAYLKPAIKTGGTAYEGTEDTETAGNYKNGSYQWTTNPQTGVAWTWNDLTNLQAGVSLKNQSNTTRCTQVYVEVDYTAVTAKTSSDTGSGADAYVSLQMTEAKTSSDTGSGVEGTPLPSATLAGSETGSGIEILVARLLAAFDTGTSVEVSILFGDLFRELFATELGQGIDALAVKREIFAGGEGTKFFGGGHEPPHRAS